MSKINKRQQIQCIDLLEQELLVPVMLEGFFPLGFLIKLPLTGPYVMKWRTRKKGMKKRETFRNSREDSKYSKGFASMHGLEANIPFAKRDTSTCCCCLTTPSALCL